MATPEERLFSLYYGSDGINPLLESIQDKLDDTRSKIIEQFTEQLDRLAGSMPDRKSLQSTLHDFDKMKADLQSTMMSGLGAQAQKNLVEKMESQLDDRAEELKQFQNVVKATIERELQQHLGGKGAEEDTGHDVQGNSESIEHVGKLRKLYSELKEAFNPQIVARWMYARTALTLSETEQILASQTPSDAADILLKILLKAPCEVFQYFLDALKQTDQEHVYKRIQCLDVTQKCELHCDIIRKHYIYLVDKMEVMHSSIVLHLCDRVLSLRETEDINAERTSTRKNEKLLSVLCRKSEGQWGLFLTALDNTGQSHIRKHITTLTDLELKQLELEEAQKKYLETVERLNRATKAIQDAAVAGDDAELTVDQGDEWDDKDATGEYTEGEDHTIQRPITTELSDTDH